MAKIYKNVMELIGRTPLMELCNLEKEMDLSGRLLAKLECFNPAGSAKDRVGKSMIEDAETRGILKPGATIIEPTSGNTGIGLAAVAASKGYKMILTMPETMSVERQNLLKAYGAEIVLTEGAKGMQGAVDRANALAAQIPGSFIPGQFVNPANPRAHYNATGPEIWEDAEGNVDYFVAGVGTGGTISGAGRYLKEQNKEIRIIAVEPKKSPLLSEGKAGAHGLQGIGANFIPEALDQTVYDEIIPVMEQDAYEIGRKLVRREGILVGISSGAALWAGIQVAKRKEAAGKSIVVLLTDTGERYLSTPMFQED